MEEVYIVQAYRTAVGKSKKGKLLFTRADDLGAGLINKMTKQLISFQSGKYLACEFSKKLFTMYKLYF